MRGYWLYLVVLYGAFAAMVAMGYYFIGHQDRLALDIIQEHQRCLQGTFQAPWQYRPLMVWMAERLVGGLQGITDLPIIVAYTILRFIFLWLAFISFHIYCRKWLTTAESILATATIVPMVWLSMLFYVGCHSDWLNLLLFILGFIAISRDRYIYLLPIIAAGVPNREMVLFLCVWALADAVMKRKLNYATLGILAAAGVVGMSEYLAIRAHFGPRPRLTPLVMFLDNFGSLTSAARNIIIPAVVFNIFWVLPYLRFSRLPRFFKPALLIVPLFVVLHYVIAIPYEVRLFLPLVPLVIPAGYLTLFELIGGGERDS
ncbi:MAG: hypothetical protein R6V19_00600 [Armatimonadota bacterium]